MKSCKNRIAAGSRALVVPSACRISMKRPSRSREPRIRGEEPGHGLSDTGDDVQGVVAEEVDAFVCANHVAV